MNSSRSGTSGRRIDSFGILSPLKLCEENSLSNRKSLLVLTMAAILIATTAVVYAHQVETFTVNPGQATLFKINLDDKDYVNCTFGTQDINFYITNPQGAKILDLGLVRGLKNVEFTAQGSGQYILHFENPYSWTEHGPSLMTVVLDIPTKGTPMWVFLLILFVVAAVLVVGISVFQRRNSNKRAKLTST